MAARSEHYVVDRCARWLRHLLFCLSQHSPNHGPPSISFSQADPSEHHAFGRCAPGLRPSLPSLVPSVRHLDGTLCTHTAEPSMLTFFSFLFFTTLPQSWPSLSHSQADPPEHHAFGRCAPGLHPSLPSLVLSVWHSEGTLCTTEPLRPTPPTERSNRLQETPTEG